MEIDCSYVNFGEKTKCLFIVKHGMAIVVVQAALDCRTACTIMAAPLSSPQVFIVIWFYNDVQFAFL